MKHRRETCPITLYHHKSLRAKVCAAGCFPSTGMTDTRNLFERGKKRKKRHQEGMGKNAVFQILHSVSFHLVKC